MKYRGIKYDNLFMKKLNKIYDLEGRNKAIVLFKFFAALLITYSHLVSTQIRA